LPGSERSEWRWHQRPSQTEIRPPNQDRRYIKAVEWVGVGGGGGGGGEPLGAVAQFSISADSELHAHDGDGDRRISIQPGRNNPGHPLHIAERPTAPVTHEQYSRCCRSCRDHHPGGRLLRGRLGRSAARGYTSRQRSLLWTHASRIAPMSPSPRIRIVCDGRLRLRNPTLSYLVCLFLGGFSEWSVSMSER